MSSRPDGDRNPPRLAPEDDWFAAPGPPGSDWFGPASDERPPREPDFWEDEPVADEHYDDHDDHAPPGLGQRQLTVVLAAVGIVAVIAVAILVVRAFGGSDETAQTTALTSEAAVTEPATTEPVATPTPASTEPASTESASTTPASTTPKVTSVPAEQTLRAGMSGSSVLALQQALVQLGYDPGTPDGSYGPGTTQAVSAFQSANGLTADGVAGPTTLKAINDALARG